MKGSNTNNSLILIDSHVHLHDCYGLDKLFNSALNNFQAIGTKQGNNQQINGVLLLTEISGQNYFLDLWEQTKTGKNKLKNWEIYHTEENCSLNLNHKLNNQTITLLAGRQILTAEKMEVLALITEQNFADGLSLEATLTAITNAGGIPVIPWGVGKWIGSRGKILSQLLAKNEFPSLFLGDNSGRPLFWPRPAYFKVAEAQGLRILPGTDPLALNWEFSRPGSYGLIIEDSLNLEQPGKQIKEILLNPQTSWQTYGNLEKPWRFVLNQTAIRLGSKSS